MDKQPISAHDIGMNPTRILAVAGAVTAALATASSLSTPAFASGPPQIDLGNSHCYQSTFRDTTKTGRISFECDYIVNGGSGTVTAAFYSNAGIAHVYPHTGTYFGLDGNCYTDRTTTITARFTDSTGAQDAVTYTVDCTEYE